MTATVDIDPMEMRKTLKGLFPHVKFFPDSSKDWPPELFDEIDICRLIRKNNIDIKKKETIVLAMIKNKKFSTLFPENVPLEGQEWDELKKKICSGGEVMHYFLDKTDKIFIEGFNTVVRDEIKLSDTYSPRTSDLFVEEVFSGKTFLIDELDDPKNLNICEHSPPSIYGAFEYYVHKQYTLIRLAREFPIEDLQKEWKSELEKKLRDRNKSNNYLGLEYFYVDFVKVYNKMCKKHKYRSNKKPDIDLAWEIVNELFIKDLKRMQKLKIKEEYTYYDKVRFRFIADVRKMIGKILESSSKNSNSCVPTDFITLAGQISGQLKHVKTKSKFDLDREGDEGFSNSKGFVDDDLSSEEENHNFVYKLFEIEDGKKFAEFLKQEFNAHDENDFIEFFVKEHKRFLLENEYIKYYKQSGNLLFKIYSGERKKVSENIFSYKLKKSLKRYRKWYRETHPKEGKNEKRT